MGRSFGNVEHKVAEADFFLEKMRESARKIIEIQFYASAFLSAARSITFAIQASISDVEGFDAWYETIKERLGKSEIAKFFVKARNVSQKVGHFPIGGYFLEYPDGVIRLGQGFAPTGDEPDAFVPPLDAITACTQYLALILSVVSECYEKFGYLIDSSQFFTVDNMKRLNLTIEDMEEQAGYPRGWTSGTSDERRLQSLRERHPEPYIDYFLVKYLGKDRYSVSVDHEKASSYWGLYNPPLDDA